MDTQCLVYLGSFVSPGVISQILIISLIQGPFLGRVAKLDFPVLDALNWLLVVAAISIAAAGYLAKTKMNRLTKKHWLTR
jgi:hypothetical protein